MANVTVGDALHKMRTDLGEGPMVIIQDGSCTHQGTVSYFIFNGAYSYLRSKEVAEYSVEDCYIATKG